MTHGAEGGTKKTEDNDQMTDNSPGAYHTLNEQMILSLNLNMIAFCNLTGISLDDIIEQTIKKGIAGYQWI